MPIFDNNCSSSLINDYSLNFFKQTIAIIKSTAPLLKQHGQKITTRMYQIMFERYRQVKTHFDLFAQANGSQPAKLAQAL